MARTANFTITEDFRKVLKDSTKRVIIFRAHIFSDRQQRDDNFFVFCDYIDEDTIIADISNSMIGDYQANWVTLQYLAIDNDNYRQFLSETRSINSLISKSGWEDAFDRIRMEGDTGDLDIEAYASNYLVLDFSKYEVNCSIQLMNTFDRGDLEFIHSHYHSKNLSDKDILTSVGEKLAYYDDLEYSKLEQNENETLRDKTEIESDRFNPSKPDGLKLKNKVNYVRMFRPEEYYHMGDFTVKLLGKPLSKTKYNYSSNEVNNDDKMDREDLKVLGVTNPGSTNQDRDLQYVDMFEYNRYLQPVFRQWDKNINPNKITKTNPYLYTIKDVKGTWSHVYKGFLTYFKVLTSTELIEVVIKGDYYTPGMPDFDFTDTLHATIKVAGGSQITKTEKIQLSYKLVGSSLQLYFKLDDSFYNADKTLTLLEAGIQSYNGSKDELTLMDEGIQGSSEVTNFYDSNVDIIQNTANDLTAIGNTEEVTSSDGRNIWNGNLLNDHYKGPSHGFISQGDDPQYAKFVFSDCDYYGNTYNPFYIRSPETNKAEVSVTLIGGKLNNQDTDKVVLGVPFLCVRKGFRSYGQAITDKLETYGNVSINGVNNKLTVTAEATFQYNDVIIDNNGLILKGSNSGIWHKSNGNHKIISFVDGADGNGDFMLIGGAHGNTALGSGEAAISWNRLDEALKENNYHKSYESGVNDQIYPSYRQNISDVTYEELILASDVGITFVTECQGDASPRANSKVARLCSYNEGSAYNSDPAIYGRYGFVLDCSKSASTKVSYRACNGNGEIELLNETNRGVYNPNSNNGHWLIAYIKNNSGLKSGVSNGDTYIDASGSYRVVINKDTKILGNNLEVGFLQNDTSDRYIQCSNNGEKISLRVTSNIRGLYDVNYNNWFMYSAANANDTWTDKNIMPRTHGTGSLGGLNNFWGWMYTDNIQVSTSIKTLYSNSTIGADPLNQRWSTIYGTDINAVRFRVRYIGSNEAGSNSATPTDVTTDATVVGKTGFFRLQKKVTLDFTGDLLEYNRGDVIFITNTSGVADAKITFYPGDGLNNGIQTISSSSETTKLPRYGAAILICTEVFTNKKRSFAVVEEDD